MRKIASKIAVLSLLFSAASTHAVLIGPGPGTQNITAPINFPSWNNVGKVSLGGGVYLGNRWVISAVHLDPMTNNSITFPGIGGPYALENTPGTYHIITNANGTPTDMVLMHMTVDPGLPTLNIPTSSPVLGTPVTMTGFGSVRGAAVQYDGSYNEVASGGVYSGYKFNPNVAGPKRWGTSNTSTFDGVHTVLIAALPSSTTNTAVFTAEFRKSSNGGTADEALAVNGDSGGAVFSTSSPNTLLGIMLYQDALTIPGGQPYDPASNLGTALYGDGTDAGNLATYAPQILSVTGIPEPTTLGLISVAGTLLIRRRKRAFSDAGNIERPVESPKYH